jgi:hypothetical protein
MNKIKGLGDIVAIVTQYTGIKWLVKKIWGEDCGCDQRQEQLNKVVSFQQKPDQVQKINIKPVSTPPVQ